MGDVPCEEAAEGHAHWVAIADHAHHLQNSYILQLSGHQGAVEGVGLACAVGPHAMHEVRVAELELTADL